MRVHEVLDPVDGSLTCTASFPAQDLALLCTIFLGEAGKRLLKALSVVAAFIFIIIV